jgi:flagellar motor switch/type III secretory pathway protein FliN
MDEMMVRFLTESPLAEKIKLPSSVVVLKTEMSPHEVAAIVKSGSYGPIPAARGVCELRVGGQCVAYGSIVRRKGEHYFKVARLAAGAKAKEV